MDDFTRGYIEAALWTSRDAHDRNLDEAYTVEDLHPDSLQAIKEDCAVFQRLQFVALHHAEKHRNREHLGHDFWLTRNGHGTGFWDRAEIPEEWREKLTKAAEFFGPADLYVWNDVIRYTST